MNYRMKRFFKAAFSSVKFLFLILLPDAMKMENGEYYRPEDSTGISLTFHLQHKEICPLIKNVLSEATCSLPIECAMKCAPDPFCAGYNFKSKQRKRNCQLTNSTRHNFDHCNSDEKGWIFYHTVGSGKIPCHKMKNCKNGGKTIIDLKDGSGSDPYRCECAHGYTGDLCEIDIDQCLNNSTNECHTEAICTNTEGSYNCACKDGFHGNGKNCSDIDECLNNSTNECDTEANCTNTEGSYNCTCKNGFQGDGKNCTVHVLDSQILSNEPADFTKVLGDWLPKTGSWAACWRATRDGWAASTFHSNCDGKVPTLVIVKVVKDSKNLIFGGYSTVAWASVNDCERAPGSFIYSLRNNDGLVPFKSTLKAENDECAIRRHTFIGPIFGWIDDLYIASDAGSNTKSYTNFGRSYNLPHGYTYQENNTRSLLGGSFQFTPSEVEVLYLN